VNISATVDLRRFIGLIRSVVKLESGPSLVASGDVTPFWSAHRDGFDPASVTIAATRFRRIGVFAASPTIRTPPAWQSIGAGMAP
jgi:hypothetical protein